ncbi:MAG: hypothetical protein PSV22_03115 [Pseudolabrys sp.]|nr:hypothetical protein [Pseudolabrys sp.]
MKRSELLINVVIACLTFLAVNIGALNHRALAQITSPTSPYKSRLTLQNSGQNAALTVHRSSLGKPCLNIEAASRAHVINPDVYDNIVSFQNQCNILIKVRVCYFGTESCVDVEVPAQKRTDAVLGIRPHSQYFRYSYKEKF